MGRKRRTFIALEIPDEVREAVARIQTRLARSGAKLRMVDPGKIHLTLKFLGDLEETLLDPVCRGVERGALLVEPFDFSFRGVGAFPHARKPRVIHLGCESSPPDSLRLLHQAVEQELEALGIPREGRAFRPHATLARVKGPPGPDLADLLAKFSDYEAGEGTAAEVVVFLSELTPGGPIYTRVGSGSLGR